KQAGLLACQLYRRKRKAPHAEGLPRQGTNGTPVLDIERLNTEVHVRHKRRALTADEIQKLAKAARSSSEGRKPSQAVTKSALNEPRQEMANPCDGRGCKKDRHQLSPDDTNADERRARGSNPQPLAGHHISSVAANHSLTLRT